MLSPAAHYLKTQKNWLWHAAVESHAFRKLLDVTMQPTDSGNYTYPNGTVFVSLDDSTNKNADGSGGCSPW